MDRRRMMYKNKTDVIYPQKIIVEKTCTNGKDISDLLSEYVEGDYTFLLQGNYQMIKLRIINLYVQYMQTGKVL